MGTKDSAIKVRLSSEYLEILDKYCNALNFTTSLKLNRSDIVRMLICYAFDNKLFVNDDVENNTKAFEYYSSDVIDRYKTKKSLNEKWQLFLQENNLENNNVIPDEFIVKFNEKYQGLLDYSNLTDLSIYEFFEKDEEK